MFVGHYAVSFAARRFELSMPLWILFLAVQFLDVLWAPFVLIGIEKVRIVPGFTASNPFDLYYMPYTHSLPGALFWSCVAGVAYRMASRLRLWKAGIIVGVAVFSHWILDFIVHRPDLPLYDNAAKVGLGLWNYPMAALGLEAALLLGGILILPKANRPRFIGTLIFGVLMIAIQGYTFFGPSPASDRAFAWTALVFYAAFAAIIWWLQDRRISTEA